jgi:glycosyltransferase involved in cell wall biosynthesis
VTDKTLFSVVLPTFNRPKQLVRCLEALADQDFPKARFEVIVVDDGGSQPLDGTVGAFDSRMRIKLLRQLNGGCAAARQFGIDHAQGEYLAFTDDDCTPASDWLTQVESALKRVPNCAVGGPTVNGAVDDLYAEATQSIVETLTLSGRDAEGFVRYAPTSNLVFPAALFSADGGLDRTWRIAGGEDRDLCARWLDAGHRLFFEPLAKVIHCHRLTPQRFLGQHFDYGRGAWHYYTSLRPFRRLEKPALYPKLFLTPFRSQAFGRGVAICGLVLLAQLATGAGFLAETFGSGPRRGRKPSGSTKSTNRQADPAKRAS